MPSDFLEKTLEDIIFENQDIIAERGFEKFYSHTERQFRLPDGGIIDILTWEIKGDVLYAKIIELKKDTCTENAVWQGLEYFSQFTMGIVEYFSEIKVDLIIVGNNISYRAASILRANPKNLKLYSYSYRWDGIFFLYHDYSLDSIIADERKRPQTLSKIHKPDLSAYLRQKDSNKIYELNKQPK